MKNILSFGLAILFVLLLLAGCSKKETKENAVIYLTKMNEYVMSNEYKDLMKSAFKEGEGLIGNPSTSTGNPTDIILSPFGKSTTARMKGKEYTYERIFEMIEKKSDYIAEDMGFKDRKELEAVVKKFKDDVEVKDKVVQLEKAVQSNVIKIVLEMTAKTP